MRSRRFAAVGILGRGVITAEEARDARDFLEALAGISATIGASARDGANEVAALAVQLGRLGPPPALKRGA